MMDFFNMQQEFKMEDWKRIFDVNVHGVFATVQAVAK